MASIFTFGGRATRRPTVRAIVDDTRMIPTGTGSTRIVALLGVSEGGEPGKPEFFNSSIQAAARVRGGSLRTALPLVFAPSPESFGASVICCVRVNPATKSTKTLLDSAAANSIVISSANWGVKDNGITVKVETGTSSGKKLTVSDGTATIPRDNLYREAFTIRYVGAGSAAVMTIDADNLATTVTGGPGGENLNVDFNAFATLKSLVDFVDAQAAYTCTLNSPNPEDVTLNGLDFVTALDIKTAAVIVQGSLNEIIRWLNTGTQGLITATRASGAGLVPANIATTYLAGGTEGTADATAWQNALDALAAVDVSYVTALTGDAAIHTKVAAHVQEQSSNALRQRRAFLGAALGEYSADLAAYRTRANGLNTDRVALIPMGITVANERSEPTALAPFYLAALLAGMQSGLPEIGDSLTNRAVSVNNLEFVPTPAQVEVGISYGLCMVEAIDGRGGFRVARGITTWLANDAYHRVEISTAEALDEVIRRMVTGLDYFKGKKASPIMVHRVVSKAEEILRDLTRDSIIVGEPSFQDLIGELQADTIFLSFQCSPVLSINFLAVSIHAVPATGTFRVAVA